MIILPLLIPHSTLGIRRLRDEPAEYERLASWLSDPRVLAFYEGRDQAFTPQLARQKFCPRIHPGESCLPCIIEQAGRPVGYVQLCQLEAGELHEYSLEPAGLAYGLDLFIGEPELWGQGIGRQIVSALTQALFARGAEWVTLDPHIDNARALRCYESCGFQKIKLLPAHELHEGRWVDCWLMACRRSPD